MNNVSFILLGLFKTKSIVTRTKNIILTFLARIRPRCQGNTSTNATLSKTFHKTEIRYSSLASFKKKKKTESVLPSVPYFQRIKKQRSQEIQYNR